MIGSLPNMPFRMHQLAAVGDLIPSEFSQKPLPGVIKVDRRLQNAISVRKGTPSILHWLDLLSLGV